MSEFDQYNEDQTPARPTFLKVLCILSFISLGFGALSSISSVFSGPQTDEQMLEAQVEMSKSIDQMKELGANGFVHFFEQMQGLLVDTNDHHTLATLVGIFVIALGFFAVLRMWQGYRMGFYLYLAYSLAGAFSVYIYVSPAHVPMAIPIIALVLSAIFILLYSRNLHWMLK